MSPAGSHQSSGSEMDDRKQKRKLSNRESARRSRIRKQQHLQDLTNKAAQLKNENGQIVARVNALTQHHLRLEYENSTLRAQAMELTDRLQSLSSVLRFVEELSGVAMDVPEMPGSLNPWHPPRPALPIMASADMFQR